MHTADCTKLFFNYFGNSSTIIYLSDECLLWNHKTWILYHCSFRRSWFRNEHFTQFQSLYSDRTSKKVCIWCRKNTFRSWISYHFFCYWDDYQFFEISLPPIFRLVRKINKYVFFTIYLKHDICFSFFFVTWSFFHQKWIFVDRVKNAITLIILLALMRRIVLFGWSKMKFTRMSEYTEKRLMLNVVTTALKPC